MLDAKYFNTLELDVINNKYYDADAVDDILVDIRNQATEMNREIERLKAELSSNHSRDPEQIPSQSDEFYIRSVYRLYSKMKTSCEATISDLNREWQDFLASTAESSPGDLKSKVAGIADAIDQIENNTPFRM